MIEIEFQGEKKAFTMMQNWPVRQPRPVAKKLMANYPLLTGQRCVPYTLTCLLLRPLPFASTVSPPLCRVGVRLSLSLSSVRHAFQMDR